MRQQVIEEARSWLRTPYHHQASVKGAGVDCAMLLIAVYHACGLIPHIDPRPYPHDWMMHRDEEKFLSWLQQYGDEVQKPEPADVIVWQFGRTYSHGAILVDSDGTIVHSYLQAGMVTLGNLQDSELAMRKAKYFKVRGIE